MSRTNGSTLLHASPVRFLIWCKFLAGVARAAKEIRAAQIFIALIKHLFVTFPELGLWYIICDCICSKRISYAWRFCLPNSSLVMILYWASVSLNCHLFDVLYRHKLFNEKKMSTRISRRLWPKQKVLERCGVFDSDYEASSGNHVLYSHSPWATYLSLTTNIGN